MVRDIQDPGGNVRIIYHRKDIIQPDVSMRKQKGTKKRPKMRSAVILSLNHINTVVVVITDILFQGEFVNLWTCPACPLFFGSGLGFPNDQALPAYVQPYLTGLDNSLLTARNTRHSSGTIHYRHSSAAGRVFFYGTLSIPGISYWWILSAPAMDR